MLLFKLSLLIVVLLEFLGCIESMEDYIPVLQLQSLAPNSSEVVTVDGCEVLLCHADGEVFAVENRCTHQQAPLAGGRIRRGHVSCPLHGVRFNLRTGEPVGQLTRVPLKTFDVLVDDGMVAVKVS
ncbi:Rieske (2Fe-2S) protein [Luminiphilus sp. nBUS_07]|uniref:Rieske (2Fe-2S) protein n=1 Tax=Luminiphilus sp. nBUS_07 TaxID=3395314 RepID=UPI003EB69E75